MHSHYGVYILFEEYFENLTGTGVHGALLALEQNSFTSDGLASVLNIPTSAPLVCKHLATEHSFTLEWKSRGKVCLCVCVHVFVCE